jgi:N utilization substance protein A
MANKKKKKPTKAKKIAAKKKRPVKKAPRKLVRKKSAPKRKLAKKRSGLKKTVAKAKVAGKKSSVTKTASAVRKPAPERSHSLDGETFSLSGVRSRSAAQSGDLQGLSNLERADSESVDELLEEGNTFEAGAVAGVERADDADEEEVHTHEVPEDDVPGEYLDED